MKCGRNSTTEKSGYRFHTGQQTISNSLPTILVPQRPGVPDYLRLTAGVDELPAHFSPHECQVFLCFKETAFISTTHEIYVNRAFPIEHPYPLDTKAPGRQPGANPVSVFTHAL
jgi:hypothetical protein